MSHEANDRVLIEFMTRYLEDRESGQVKSLSSYLADYPGNEASVAQYYLGMEAEGLDTDGFLTPREFSTVNEQSAEPNDLTAGSDVIGPYRLLEEIGRGGQATVHLAIDTRLNRNVALKILTRSVGGADNHFLRFRREAEIVAALEVPGICPVYDVGEDLGHSYIAMQLIKGQTLQEEIKARRTRPQTPAEFKRLAQLMASIARTLSAAHEARVIHRDLKPANIMVNESGDPILLDFGLARAEDLDSLTHSDGGLQGTPAYMSPEQITGRPVDSRSDVYSLGATLFFALTHEHPFKGATLQVLARRISEGQLSSDRLRNPTIPKDLRVIVETALATAPALRYHSAEALAEDLEAFSEGRPISARPPSPWRRLSAWARRHPVAAVSSAFIIVGLTTGLVLGLLYLKQQAEARKLDAQKSARIQLEWNRFRQTAATLEVRGLIEAEPGLHPAGPKLIEPIKSWLAQAQVQLNAEKDHRAVLLSLEGEAGQESQLSQSDKRWLAAMLKELLKRTADLEKLIPVMEDRLQRSQTLVARSIETHRALWDECISAIAQSERYAKLKLSPQVGLVPLGHNPESELWEFWHVESGAKPRYDRRRERWYPTVGSGLVMVLLPGGTFTMGKAHIDDAIPRENPLANRTAENMSPPHEVTLAPFFLSAFETTQDQWIRLSRGPNPSRYQLGSKAGLMKYRERISLLNPVEWVSWHQCTTISLQYGLALPTEAQWEYAAYAASTSPWPFGMDLRLIKEHGNTRCLEWEVEEEQLKVIKLLGISDGRLVHNQVGSYQPSPFGLYDIHGNVWEWCQDAYYRNYYDVAHAPGSGLITHARDQTPDKSIRGGSYYKEPAASQAPSRAQQPPTSRSYELGLRLARSLDHPNFMKKIR